MPRRGQQCDGLPVTEITVVSRGPFLEGVVYRRMRWLGKISDRLHAETREGIIRRFLILEVGKPCTELRRGESERILRAQPYLAEADVRAVPDGTGGVRIEVTTADELSTLLGLGVRTAPKSELTVLKLGSANLAGQAIYALGEWRKGFFYRDLWGMRFTDYQFAGRPYQLNVSGTRRPIGGEWDAEFSHPFLTDLQRIAWRMSGGESSTYVRYLRKEGRSPALKLERSFVDVGGIVRIGVPGRLSLFGASISREREAPGELPVIITDSGIMRDTSPELTRRFIRHSTGRVNALWGVRNVAFKRVTGFDALLAPQDVRIGFQFGTLFGRGLSVVGSADDDIFVSADMYAGAGSRRSFVGLQVSGEGRQDYDRNKWDGVLASGRLAWYLKPALPQTTILSAEFSSGWRQRVPFQLALGEFDGGVRGYRKSTAAGSQRAIARLEHRWLWPGVINRTGALAVGGFADAGRVWAGDTPFGVDSKLNASVGVSLFAAVPPRSKRLWRLDVAFPRGPDRGKSMEFRLTSGDHSRNFWAEPPNVRRGRERSVPTSIFTWP